MASLALRRHAQPASTLATFVAVALAAGAARDRAGLLQLALGVALVGLSWLVEWRGIQGTFENRVPRSRAVIAARAVWVVGLAVAVVDALWARWTPWQGPAVRAAGVAIGAGGVALRLWSMRTLGGAFSYDLKIVEGHTLVRRGPYRWLRHPSYTGMLLWSAGLGLWNPSLPGLAILIPSTVLQLAHRIEHEERLLAAHFGEAWRAHARATSRVIPLVW